MQDIYYILICLNVNNSIFNRIYFANFPPGMLLQFMPNTQIRQLFQCYQQEREAPFSLDQFTSFLAFFPALLIAASDGIVDREEWQYCQQLAQGLGYSYREELAPEDTAKLTLLYRQEFVYLLKNLEHWEEPFLQALESFFRHNLFAKKFVSQTTWLFADASEGVSLEEETKMRYLCRRFDLDQEDMQPFDDFNS